LNTNIIVRYNYIKIINVISNYISTKTTCFIYKRQIENDRRFKIDKSRCTLIKLEIGDGKDRRKT